MNYTFSGRWQWLNGRGLFLALLVLNVLVTCAVFYGFRNAISGDHYTYLKYVEGLKQGRYSLWYNLPEYIPDTFRNPGYPLFLYAISFFTNSLLAIKVIQLLLYMASLGLILRVIARHETAYLMRNVFLLLLLPNIQLAYFSAVVFPEILVCFLVTAYFYVSVSYPQSWTRSLYLALLAGAVFQVRPVFLFFPALQLALEFLLNRRSFRWAPALATLVVFGATMIPYGAWNYQRNGVFKVTSLEGGGGVMQLGFWAFRIPNYQEQRYWFNTAGDELVQFVDAEQVPANIKAFNAEWDSIDAQSAPLLSPLDRKYVPMMKSKRMTEFLFPTYSAAYTQKREKLLVHYTVQNILANPGYYLKTRVYTFVRLWVTGVQRRDWAAATTLVQKVKVTYPAIVSGITFLIALIVVPLALLRSRPLSYDFYLALAVVAYFGLIHLPFAIQARYTIPVRPLYLFTIGLALAMLLADKRRQSDPLP
jgi:hypothetical protein